MKVAIIGSAESTKDDAPFDDPEWECWGMCWRYMDHKPMDRLFEMHREEFWGDYGGELYTSWLMNPTPLHGEEKTPIVYVRPEVAKKYRKCKAYPIDKAIKLLGCDYFASSFSYALCLAIMEGAEEIALYGIDLASDEEYVYQRPNAEYILGVARAKGIKLHIPWQSALLKAPWVYGAERPPIDDPLADHFRKKIEGYDEKIEDLRSQLYTLSGAKHEAEEVVAAFGVKNRGALGGMKS